VLVSTHRDGEAARRFFTRALRCGPFPVEAVTDRAPVYPGVRDELVPSAHHITERYATDEIVNGVVAGGLFVGLISLSAAGA